MCSFPIHEYSLTHSERLLLSVVFRRQSTQGTAKLSGTKLHISASQVERCRCCERDRLDVILDLGSTPIANALLAANSPHADEKSYPLALAFCESCSLVQLAYELPAETIFDADYPYYSSFSSELADHARRHVDDLLQTRALTADSTVVELGSNDGYLLKHFVTHGVRVLGIDPSPGPAQEAEKVGVPTVTEFFNAQLATKLRDEGVVADVIIASNVMAHVPDLNGFVEGMAILLAEDGLITVENPYLRDLIDNNEFDGIYHEHFCYFSCTAVDVLMRRHGLYINDIEYFPNLHGGTLRWQVGTHDSPSSSVRRYLDEEHERGMDSLSFYASFRTTIDDVCDVLRTILEKLHEEGKTVAAYGAAAKGATLLNVLGAHVGHIRYVVDRNWHKQNKLMPGVHLLINDPSILDRDPPDYLLILAWNFKDEIMAQLASYSERGGKFIVPIPYPAVL